MAEQEKVLFIVDGKKVDGMGRVNGEAPAPAGESVADLKARIAELEAQLAANDGPQEGDTDQRTKAQLGAALTEKGIAYDAKVNRPALLALAAEHGV